MAGTSSLSGNDSMRSSFVLSNSPPSHKQSIFPPKSQHQSSSSSSAKEHIFATRKRPMLSPPGASPDGIGPSQAKKARSLQDLKAEQERLVELSISQFSNYQAKKIPPETASAMERLLKRGGLDPHFKHILETKLLAYRVHQVKKERREARSSAGIAKKSGQESVGVGGSERELQRPERAHHRPERRAQRPALESPPKPRRGNLQYN